MMPLGAEAAEPAGAAAERAFEGAQWILSSGAARAVAQVGARLAAGDGPLAATIRARQDLAGRYAKLLSDLAAGDGDDAALRREMAAVTTEIAALDDTIATSFPDYAEITNPRPVGFEAVRADLHPGEALALILPGKAGTYVWLITPEGAAWNRADLSTSAMAAAVRRLRQSLDPTAVTRSAASLDEDEGQKTGRPDFDRATAFGLYTALLAPFEGELAGTSTLYVVTEGPLTSLPLSILVTAPPEGPDDAADALRGTAWLAKRLAAAVLPSVSSLRVMRMAERREGGATPSFVGFGDPVLGVRPENGSITVASRDAGHFFTRGVGNVDAIRALAPLPGTARELNEIRRILKAPRDAVFTGTAATETAVKSADLSATRVIAFATHGLVTGDLSGLSEPALVLTPPETPTPEDDGLLTASEASALDLSADWVILSACNTAAGDGTPGASGLSGLARAFLFAGARAILVSHWPVRDDVAARMTTRTLAIQEADPETGRAAALNRAMLEIMADPRDPSLAHPSAWAPFVIVGEGGSQ
jgi:CHAT domain-containing protein